MSSYSLPLPVSVAITQNSFGSVWTSLYYSAQPPAPILHESSPMHSLLHLIGSCEGPACVAHPYPFLSISVTRSSIESHYYITLGRAASGQVTLLCRVSLHRVTSHRVTSHRVMSLSCVGSHCIGSHRIGSRRIGSGHVTLPARVLLHRVTSHQVALHRVMLHRVGTLSCIGSRSIGSHCIRSRCIGLHYIGFALRFSPCHFSFCLCVPEPFPLL